MKELFKKITKKFGWKELLLCLALAAVVTIFVVVFTGNTAEVSFNSVGGSFDEGDGAKIYDYDAYIVGSSSASNNNYHEILTKTYRISSVATLPEPTRDGYTFDGWFEATVDEDGTIIYSDVEFTESSVKSLEKDEIKVVFAKWTPLENGASAEKTRSENIIAALNITWKGMLGIFLVIGIIFGCIVGLNFASKKISELKSKKNHNS